MMFDHYGSTVQDYERDIQAGYKQLYDDATSRRP